MTYTRSVQIVTSRSEESLEVTSSGYRGNGHADVSVWTEMAADGFPLAVSAPRSSLYAFWSEKTGEKKTITTSNVILTTTSLSPSVRMDPFEESTPPSFPPDRHYRNQTSERRVSSETAPAFKKV